QELGHKKIDIIAMKKDIDRTEERHKVTGYEKAMKEENLDTNGIYTMGVSEKDVLDVSDEIIKSVKEGTTAFCCTQDELAIFTINTLVDNGYKVPEDISVTGFGGTALSGIYRPKLTTVKIPYYDIGAVAIRKILKEIKKETTEEEAIVLPV